MPSFILETYVTRLPAGGLEDLVARARSGHGRDTGQPHPLVLRPRGRHVHACLRGAVGRRRCRRSQTSAGLETERIVQSVGELADAQPGRTHMSWRILLAAAVGALVARDPTRRTETAIPTGNLVENPGAEDSPGTEVAHRRQARRLDDDRESLDLDQYAPREGDWPNAGVRGDDRRRKELLRRRPRRQLGSKQTTHTATQSDRRVRRGDGDRRRSGRGDAHGLPRRVHRGRGSRDRERTGSSMPPAPQLGSVRVGPVSIDDRKRLTVPAQAHRSGERSAEHTGHRRRDRGHAPTATARTTPTSTTSR